MNLVFKYFNFCVPGVTAAGANGLWAGGTALPVADVSWVGAGVVTVEAVVIPPDDTDRICLEVPLSDPLLPDVPLVSGLLMAGPPLVVNLLPLVAGPTLLC